MDKKPFFSIVMATYNRGKLLKRALTSLIAQSEQDWEAIIVDDGSTDDTYSEISPFLARHTNLKYVKKTHSGEAKSKNAGIWASKGKYITFLDSDDEYGPNHLKHRKVLLSKNPDVKLLYGGVKIIGNQFVPDRFDNSKRIHLKECAIGGSFFMERNTLLQLNGLKNIPLGADSNLFDRAVEARIKMMETDVQSYIYHRDSQDSITNTFSFG